MFHDTAGQEQLTEEIIFNVERLVDGVRRIVRPDLYVKGPNAHTARKIEQEKGRKRQSLSEDL
jgi:hypothetical protein